MLPIKIRYFSSKLIFVILIIAIVFGPGFIIKNDKNISRTPKLQNEKLTATFIWHNPDKSTITGFFEDGKLVRKKQKGL